MNELRECAGEAGHSHRRAVMSTETADFVVRRLFTAGLALGSCVRLLDDGPAKRVTALIGELDEIGRDVRRTIRLEGRDVRNGRDRGDRPGGGHSAGDYRQSMIAGTEDVLAEISDRLRALTRSDNTEQVP